MMIHLPNGYNGRLVQYQSVPPGDYADDDPRLFGIADYLVSNGFATRLDAPAVKPEPVAAPTDDDGLVKVNTTTERVTVGSKPKPKRR